jgi:GGDEF domain-containing protein
LLPDSPKTAEELIKEADMAMYRVKAAGKDGIYVAQEGS